MATKRSPTAAKSLPAADNFKLIKGIGPVIERRLNGAGIRTFKQLAVLSPARLAKLIPGLQAKRIAKQGWISRARRLASQRAKTKLFIDTGTTPGRQRYATFTIELLLDEASRVRRTRVVHVQDGEEGLWANWDEVQLINFIIGHAGLRSQLAKTGPRVTKRGERDEESHKPAPWLGLAENAPQSQMVIPAEPAIPPVVKEPLNALPMKARAEEAQADLQLAIHDVQLAELSVGELERPSPTKRMRAQVRFELSGPAARAVAARRSRFFVHVLACELITGQTTVLAVDQPQLRADLLVYTTTIGFVVPGVGRYQLMGIVLLPDEDVVGVRLGPILTVIPWATRPQSDEVSQLVAA